jgi:hypothetical protein
MSANLMSCGLAASVFIVLAHASHVVRAVTLASARLLRSAMRRALITRSVVSVTMQ